MQVKELLNPGSAEETNTKTRRKMRKKKSTSKKSKAKKRTFRAEHPEKYNALSALTIAPSGFTFPQLWQGEAVHAWKELNHILGKGKLKLIVMAEQDVDSNDDEDRFFAVSILHILSQPFQSFLESRATPNVMSPDAVKELLLSSQETSRVVTMASEAKSGVVRKLMRVPVMLEGLQADLNFIFLKHISIEIVNARPNTKRLVGMLNFLIEVVRFNSRGQEAILPMIPKYMRPKHITGSTDSEVPLPSQRKNEGRKKSMHDSDK